MDAPTPPPVFVVNLFADGPHAPDAIGHKTLGDALEQIANIKHYALGPYLGSVRVEGDGRHHLTATALDLADEAEALRREMEADARLEARHAAGLRIPSC